MKFKPYRGGDLDGKWEASYKIDGVHAVFSQITRTVTSKRGKPLHNLQHLLERGYSGRYEVFKDDWETSVSMVRTHNGSPITEDCLYKLEPLDPRLWLEDLDDPKDQEIWQLLEDANSLGYEGVVLTKGPARYKVKPSLTVDVRVSGLHAGTGKYEGMLGAFLTNYGKVGSGLTDKEREEFWRLNPKMGGYELIGSIIEVEFMEWTKDGKMRHPRFKRVRWDKDEENLER